MNDHSNNTVNQPKKLVPPPFAPVVKVDSFLTLHYRLSGEHGDVINTFGGQPATLSMGDGALAEPLEQRLLGLAEG